MRDIEKYLKPGAYVPVDFETTGKLLQHIFQLEQIAGRMATQLRTARLLMSVSVHDGHLTQIDDALAEWEKVKK